MTFELLYSDVIWICDSGASSRSGKNKRGAKNIKSSSSQSLGRTGNVVKALNTMDFAGQFIGKDGSSGIKATLTDVNYNNRYNFNLVSLIRLLSIWYEKVFFVDFIQCGRSMARWKAENETIQNGAHKKC